MSIRLWSTMAMAVLLAGCAAPSGQWTWVPAQESGVENLSQAIADCEYYSQVVNSNGNFKGFENARPYGGWGDFLLRVLHESTGMGAALSAAEGVRRAKIIWRRFDTEPRRHREPPLPNPLPPGERGI